MMWAARRSSSSRVMYFKQRERAEKLEAISILESAVQIVMRFSYPIEFELLNFRRSGPLA